MEYMDATGSLRKIALELQILETQIQDQTHRDQISGAAFLIKWIADGLDVELELAAKRGRSQQGQESCHVCGWFKSWDGFSKIACSNPQCPLRNHTPPTNRLEIGKAE